MKRWLLLLTLVVLAISGHELRAQSTMEKLITPGPLSNAHAKLESKCSSCHESFSRPAQNSKCLSCHKGVAADINTGVGFHGKSTAGKQQCKGCHSEHKGRGYALSQFTKSKFNHNLTDYPLAGGHLKATCAGCHGTSGKYRGLTGSCATCHAKKSPHMGRIGNNCAACHSVQGWKQTLPFNHASTGFSLTGGHRGVACMSCHVGQRWAGTPQQCIGCHAKNDVHKGSRGTNCASCHNTGGWKSASFDHNRNTSFPLSGQHAGAPCAGCHGANNAIRKPPRTCIGCHAKDDTHKGSRGTNCSECHNPASWKSAKFDHNKNTGFPLLGKHAATACAGCHGAGNAIKKPPLTCIGCHAKDDSHKGKNGTDCAQCHNSTDWKKASFDHNSMTKFPLFGTHKTTACEACHKQPVHVALPPSTCIGCHAADDIHKSNLGPECGSCHNATAWLDSILFDHGLTRFPLVGKHAPLTCVQCHADKTFASKGITCQSCHKDDHHAGTLGASPACAKCHNVNAWQAWRFDHDTATSYPLTGKHKGLICSACHAKPADPATAPTQCASCHQKDDIHRGGFGDKCERCHVTDDFSEINM